MVLARVCARTPPEKNMWDVNFFPCVENILGLSQLTNISGGTHAFAARVVPNNNVALAEFERLNLLIHIENQQNETMLIIAL